MEYCDESTLRMMCDGYYDPRLCEDGGARTRFIIESWEMTIDYAKLALNFYNQKMHKNFILEKVVKLNLTSSAFYCMTLRARNAESDECCLFRGVVYVVGGLQVLLCEMKDEKEIFIPADHDEYYDEESSGSMEDIYSCKWSKNDLGDDSADVDTVGLANAPSVDPLDLATEISLAWIRIRSGSI